MFLLFLPLTSTLPLFSWPIHTLGGTKTVECVFYWNTPSCCDSGNTIIGTMAFCVCFVMWERENEHTVGWTDTVPNTWNSMSQPKNCNQPIWVSVQSGCQTSTSFWFWQFFYQFLALFIWYPLCLGTSILLPKSSSFLTPFSHILTILRSFEAFWEENSNEPLTDDESIAQPARLPMTCYSR